MNALIDSSVTSMSYLRLLLAIITLFMNAAVFQ